MSFVNGDRVKVTTKNSMHEGKVWTVLNVYEDGQTLLAQYEEETGEAGIEKVGVITGFFVRELELVLSDEDREQIQKIASVLYNEPGNEDWDLEQSHKAAESLFRAGCRFRG